MKQLLVLTGCLAWAQGAAGQACVHADLSNSLTFRVSLAADKARATAEAKLVTVAITSTTNGKLHQSIRFPTGLLFSSIYQDCKATRSYSTGKNRDADATDNDYGDFIVADFNFDGLEDFAAKNDSGGNAGPLYNYYIQQANGQFSPDQFLTQEMQFFPDDISPRRRTLTTRVHAGADGLGETVFHLNKAGKWAQVSYRILPVK